MPRCVIKPHPEKDEYVIWSTVVDSPVSEVLTRDEAVREYPGGEESVARADETGASWADDRSIYWGTKEFIREVNVGDTCFKGLCYFGHIPAIIQAWKAGDTDTLQSLIQDIDD
ncbi:hypothetical protein [Corynebacterium callunae]|uniref:hypothetical protein n=1 Tax=Corynebacterium callunae TaxID=1721 RepID=UPI001FFE567C|nr:hypothetical protein [Corynebacterium callunae]MCK2199179.1 hypothetical protein [Corynebacterium callunae]